MASGERFTDMDVDLLKSINERLAKLDIMDILREDINALCARLVFSQRQIDDLSLAHNALMSSRNLSKISCLASLSLMDFNKSTSISVNLSPLALYWPPWFWFVLLIGLVVLNNAWRNTQLCISAESCPPGSETMLLWRERRWRLNGR